MLHLIAHRGDSLNSPENTLIAFQNAKEKGAAWVEFDVMLTKDEIAVVIHDETVNRTTNGSGRVADLTLDQINELDAGSWFNTKFKNERVPTLAETIVLLVRQDLNANIEIKPCGDDSATAIKTTETVINLVKSLWPLTKKAPLISSFNQHCLQLALQLAPEYPRALLLSDWREDWYQLAIKYQCYSINLDQKCLTAERVKQIKDAGFLVYSYTVNNLDRARELEEFGVDGIFSDNPVLLRSPNTEIKISGINQSLFTHKDADTSHTQEPDRSTLTRTLF